MVEKRWQEEFVNKPIRCRCPKPRINTNNIDCAIARSLVSPCKCKCHKKTRPPENFCVLIKAALCGIA